MLHKKKQNAFTLIELIIVILLIGILSISFAKILTQSVSSYFDAKTRNHHSQSAKWVIEILSRSLREALPQSIRTNNSGDLYCLEYMPIVNATSYFNLPASGEVTSFNIVTYDIVFENDFSVAIMPISPASLYAGTGVVAGISSIASSGIGQSLLTLSNPTIFSQRSPQNRVYILTTPVSYCLDNSTGNINKYINYPSTVNQQFPPNGSTSQAIAENFWANVSVFDYQVGSLQRSALLQLNFVVQDRVRNPSGTSESVEVFHEVHIRNAP
jgi:MSHA biogenesis protein MshO